MQAYFEGLKKHEGMTNVKAYMKAYLTQAKIHTHELRSIFGSFLPHSMDRSWSGTTPSDLTLSIRSTLSMSYLQNGSPTTN